MKESFKHMNTVPADDFKTRLHQVKILKEDNHEIYHVMKDRITGEHYLYYAYVHVNIAEGGQEETFHHLFPVENDDVLALIFDEAPFQYPEHWQGRFLRSGSEGHLFWFDPGAEDLNEKYEQAAKDVGEKLAHFQKEGSLDDEAIRKFLEDVDRMFDDK